MLSLNQLILYLTFNFRPASDFHCLAVSKVHIDNPKSLNLDHEVMISDMRKTLNDLIKKQPGIEDSEIMFGFHWPPFNSVKHLHMHGISPINKMGFVAKMIFKKDSYWFRSVDTVLDNLKPKTEL